MFSFVSEENIAYYGVLIQIKLLGNKLEYLSITPLKLSIYPLFV